MAVILYSSVINGQTLSFNPDTDVLSIDDPTLSAAGLILGYTSGYAAISMTLGGKLCYLPPTVALPQLGPGNVQFIDGSLLLIGNSAANTLTGGSGDDYLLGLAGNDILDGGAGADVMLGRRGNDTYIVDDINDQVIEALRHSSFTLSSTNEDGLQGNAGSTRSQLSGDGFLIFHSNADNLVANDDNGAIDIFLKDLVSGEITKIGDSSPHFRTPGGAQITNNGRYIAFESTASDLVANDTNGVSDIFLWNRKTSAFTLVSQSGNGSYAPDISEDGRYVVFDDHDRETGIHNCDVFVKDMLTGEVSSVTGGHSNRHHGNAKISGDGSIVVFETTAQDLINVGAASDSIIMKNLITGELTLVSSTSNGTPARGGSFSNNVNISDDGRYAVFDSTASNLGVGIDFFGYRDVFLKNLVTGAVTQVSTSANGETGWNNSSNADISGDGRFIVFSSRAPNLVDEASIGGDQVYVKDMHTGAIERLTKASGGSNSSLYASISANGKTITFTSDASNLQSGDSNNASDVFVVANPLYNLSSADTVKSGISYTLGAQIDRLVLTGNSAINGTGNALDNRIGGNNNNNSLDGRIGDDTLDGKGGNDTLNGSSGNDSLKGGAGADQFIFKNALNANANVDTIRDFSADSGDVIQLDNLYFTRLAGTGTLPASFFRASSSGDAADANDYILYDTDDGKLFYDADGSGAGAKIQFSTIGNLAALTAADFVVI